MALFVPQNIPDIFRYDLANRSIYRGNQIVIGRTQSCRHFDLMTFVSPFQPLQTSPDCAILPRFPIQLEEPRAIGVIDELFQCFDIYREIFDPDRYITKVTSVRDKGLR
jgi:hypothetical protein